MWSATLSCLMVRPLYSLPELFYTLSSLYVYNPFLVYIVWQHFVYKCLARLLSSWVLLTHMDTCWMLLNVAAPTTTLTLEREMACWHNICHLCLSSICFVWVRGEYGTLAPLHRQFSFRLAFKCFYHIWKQHSLTTTIQWTSGIVALWCRKVLRWTIIYIYEERTYRTCTSLHTSLLPKKGRLCFVGMFLPLMIWKGEIAKSGRRFVCPHSYILASGVKRAWWNGAPPRMHICHVCIPTTGGAHDAFIIVEPCMVHRVPMPTARNWTGLGVCIILCILIIFDIFAIILCFLTASWETCHCA